MIRVAIVEDEADYRNVLEEYLRKYGKEISESFHITTFSDGLEIASDYQPDYDIIFMDIQMKHMNGMKAAEEIRKLDEDVSFIFITTTVEYAVQGYLVDALGYVLKPVPYLAFSQILNKAIRKIKQNQEQVYLTVALEDGKKRIAVDSIFYIESQGHYILLHTEGGDFQTTGPLKKVEDLLEKKGFAKCHNAYLVNLKHVVGTKPASLVLNNGEELAISRTKKKAFMDSLNDYIGGIL